MSSPLAPGAACNRWCSSVYRGITLISAPVSHGVFPTPSAMVNLCLFSSHKATSGIGLGICTVPLWPHLNVNSYICNDPISNEVTFWDSRENMRFEGILSNLLLLLSRSVMSDSVRPQRQRPTRLRHPWDSPGKNMEWVAISFFNAWKWKVKGKLLSRVRLLATP